MTMFQFLEKATVSLNTALCIFVCYALGFSLHANAEGENVETLIVVGSEQREQSLNDTDTARYTGFAKVIERSEYEDRFTTFPELLNDVADVQVRQFGGVGSNAVISLRGSTGKQVNVFLDGFLLNSAFSGSPNMDSIPTVVVERVKVYPDFTPVNLSNANISGAINFITRDLSTGDSGGQASIAYGSFETRQLELSHWLSVNDWQVIMAGSMVESENDFPLDDKLFEGSPPLFQTPTRKRVNDAYENDNLFLKFGKDFGLIKASVLAQYFSDDKEIPSIKNNIDLDDARLETENIKLQTVIEYDLREVSFLHRFFYSEEEAVFSDSNGSIGLNPASTDQLTEQEAFGVFNVVQYMFSSHDVKISLDLRHDDMYQVNRFDGEVKVDGGRDSLVLALGDDYFVNDRWLISSDIRIYHIADSIEEHVGNIDLETDIKTHAWHLGTQYQLLDSVQLKLNFGQSVRIPTLMEKFSNTGLYQGNDELSEEHALLADAGFLIELDKLSLQASAFYKEIDDGIYILYNSQGVASPENTAKSQLGGVNGELDFSLTDAIALSANFMMIDSANQSEIKSFNGMKMPGIYHKNYGLSVSYTNAWIKITSSYQFYDELYYLSNNSFEADAKDLLDISVTFYFEPVTFDVTARNMLDENYLDYNRMPTPGRSYMATLSFNF